MKRQSLCCHELYCFSFQPLFWVLLVKDVAFRRQNQLSFERTWRLHLSKEKRCDRRQSVSGSECVKKKWRQQQDTAGKVNVAGVTTCKSQRMLTTHSSVGNHRKQRTTIYIFHKIWLMIYVHSDRITVSTNKEEETNVTDLKPRVSQVRLRPRWHV